MAPGGASGMGAPLEGLRPVSHGHITTGELVTSRGRFPQLTVSTADQVGYEAAMREGSPDVSPKSHEPWGPR
jgi:hypothetical protein